MLWSRHGWNRGQAACAHFARTRLGLLERSFESVWRAARWRCDFDQRWQGSDVGKCDLELKIANCRTSLLASATGPGLRFLQTSNRTSSGISRASRYESPSTSRGLERKRWVARGNPGSLRGRIRFAINNAGDGSTKAVYRRRHLRNPWSKDFDRTG